MQNDILVYIPSESKAAPRLSMRRLLGVPLFLRGILTLEDAGYERITLVVPISERRQVLKAWKHHTRNKKLKPHFIWTPGNQRIDTKILADVVRHSTKKVTILNANLLVSTDVLDPWKKIELKKGMHLKAVIDRGLPPLLQVNKGDLESLEKTVSERPVKMEALLVNLLNNTINHRASRNWKKPVFLVTRFTKRKAATHYLTEKIRRSTPTWIARYINKSISLPISVMLARMRVRPNTITIVNMLIGMGAGVGAAGRTYVGLLIGAILFQLASVVDGCDGEVAKLTHRCTKFGQYIDSISDNLALAGFFTGLMIHIYRVNNHTPMAFVWGGILLLGLAALFAIMINFLKKNTDSASFVTFDKEYLQKLPKTYPKFILLFIKYGKYVLKKDFFSMLILVLAIFGILPAMFYISITAVWIGVFILTYLNLRPAPAPKPVKKKLNYQLAKGHGSKR